MNRPRVKERLIEHHLTVEISNTVAPRIAGTASKKENLADSVLERPKKVPVLIVAPDLEIPGKIAID